jgi:hypothetical protein
MNGSRLSRSKKSLLPIPLADDDPDAELQLQAAFESAFDATRFDRILDASRPAPSRF